MIVSCPKHSSHSEFETTVTVQRQVVVDSSGEYVRECDYPDEQTLVRPEIGNLFRCAECGAVARVQEGTYAEDNDNVHDEHDSGDLQLENRLEILLNGEPLRNWTRERFCELFGQTEA